MKILFKKFKPILFAFALITCLTTTSSTNIMAYTVYDINEDQYVFSRTTLEEGERIRVYVTPYLGNSTPNLYIRFTNYDDAYWMVDVYDTETHTSEYKEFFDDSRVTAFIDDLEEDHVYRITIRNRSSFSAEIQGRIF